MRDERAGEIVGHGARLPELMLPAAPAGTPTALRATGRRASVVVLVPDAEPEACVAYLQQLAAARDEIAEWDGRVVVVVTGGLDTAALLQESGAVPFPVLADAERRLATRTGLDGAALLIADQWGVLHLAERLVSDRPLPDAAEVVDWLRYLAIQCPECEGEAL